jgi:transposase-like protein
VSGICRELRDRYRAFRARNLGEVRLLALLLVAWGFATDGDRVLLDVCLGQRERTEDWTELGRGLTRRGLRVVELLLRGSSASPPAWKTGGS